MECIQNPISGEIKRVTEGEALKLIRYGWGYVPKAAYRAYKAKGGLPSALGSAFRPSSDVIRRRV